VRVASTPAVSVPRVPRAPENAEGSTVTVEAAPVVLEASCRR
jgi:hypothetical protein